MKNLKKAIFAISAILTFSFAQKNFAAEFEFENNSLGNENWNHWILAFKTSSGLWYLRADAYSVESFSGSSVGYYCSGGYIFYIVMLHKRHACRQNT